MRALATEGASDQSVRETALAIVRAIPSHDVPAELAAIFRFVRDRIRFVNDIVGVETLQSPRYTLHVGQGDCDDRATLLVALARSIGVPADFRFRVVAADPNSRQFSHVYVVARLGRDEIPLDPTYSANPPGFEYPGPLRREDGPTMSYRNLGAAVRLPAGAMTRPSIERREISSIIRPTSYAQGPPSIAPLPLGPLKAAIAQVSQTIVRTVTASPQIVAQRKIVVPVPPADIGLEPIAIATRGGAQTLPTGSIPMDAASDAGTPIPSAAARGGAATTGVTPWGWLAVIGLGLMVYSGSKRPRGRR